MLCVAKVNLSDWGEGQRREVDPTNERIMGLLRGGYIVPLALPRRSEKPPEQAIVPVEAPTPAKAPEPASTPRAAATRTKRARQRAEDE